MSWAGIGNDDVPSYDDLEDAVSVGELQRTGLGPADANEMPFVGDTGLDSYSLYNLTTSPGDWPSKTDYLAARYWDPEADAPSGLGAATGTGLNRVTLSWTDDAGVPSAGGGWARADVEVVILRATSSGGTYVEIDTVAFGSGAYNDRDVGLVTGNTYWYQIRYRSMTDGSAVGALVGPASAAAGSGTI